MITKVNPYGHISLTNDYFTALAAHAAEQCYGVAALGQGTADRGVAVSEEGRRLKITLHIKVGYGLNIKTIVQSITHRVRDEVEHATGLKVECVDVFVDDILSL